MKKQYDRRNVWLPSIICTLFTSFYALLSTTCLSFRVLSGAVYVYSTAYIQYRFWYNFRIYCCLCFLECYFVYTVVGDIGIYFHRWPVNGQKVIWKWPNDTIPVTEDAEIVIFSVSLADFKEESSVAEEIVLIKIICTRTQ